MGGGVNVLRAHIAGALAQHVNIPLLPTCMCEHLNADAKLDVLLVQNAVLGKDFREALEHVAEMTDELRARHLLRRQCRWELSGWGVERAHVDVGWWGCSLF